MHNETPNDDVYYYQPRWTRRHSSQLLDSAVRNCTFSGLANLVYGGDSLFVNEVYYNSRDIWSRILYPLGYLSYSNHGIFTRDYSTQIFSVSYFLSPSNIFLIAIFVRCLPHSRWVNPDWSFRGHISRSLPSETIFRLLRSISSEFLIRANEYSEEVKLDTLEIIIKWLQVSVIKCSRRTPQTENLICVQELGSERPSDLCNRFQGELLQYKAAVPQPSSPQSSSESLPLISTRPISSFQL